MIKTISVTIVIYHVISAINHSEIGAINQLSYRTGASHCREDLRDPRTVEKSRDLLGILEIFIHMLSTFFHSYRDILYSGNIEILSVDKCGKICWKHLVI